MDDKDFSELTASVLEMDAIVNELLKIGSKVGVIQQGPLVRCYVF
jgi:hypothetical protein